MWPGRPVLAQAPTGSPIATERSTASHTSIGRTSVTWAWTAGSSDAAAVTAVSMEVRQSTPSAVAASRIADASRTGPERGDGVLTTNDTVPLPITSRIAGRPPPSSPNGATSVTAWPRSRSAADVPAVAAKR